MGIFYGGHGQILLCNFIAVVVTIAWAVSVEALGVFESIPSSSPPL